MVRIEEFSRVVSHIYASSSQRSLWVEALSEISHILDATACGIVVGAGKDRSVLSTTMPDEAITSYEKYYRNLDFVLAACEGGPVGLVRGGWDLVSSKKRSEFHVDWQRRFDVTDGLFVRLAGSKPTSFVVSAPQRDRPFETIERIRFVDALVPHLQQALRSRNYLVDSGNNVIDITAAIDAVRHGVFIVAVHGVILKLNSAAERIVASGDGLHLRRNTLEASLATTNTELQATLALATSQQGRTRAGDSLLCGRPSGKRPYIIHVLPLVTADDGDAARAVITIVDPEQDVAPPKHLLRRLFGLTNAEADIALRMLRGDGLKAIAEESALSLATVKSHVHHIFRKTKTHRQAELVRLLLAIIP